MIKVGFIKIWRTQKREFENKAIPYKICLTENIIMPLRNSQK